MSLLWMQMKRGLPPLAYKLTQCLQSLPVGGRLRFNGCRTDGQNYLKRLNGFPLAFTINLHQGKNSSFAFLCSVYLGMIRNISIQNEMFTRLSRTEIQTIRDEPRIGYGQVNIWSVGSADKRFNVHHSACVIKMLTSTREKCAHI